MRDSKETARKDDVGPPEMHYAFGQFFGSWDIEDLIRRRTGEKQLSSDCPGAGKIGPDINVSVLVD